MAARYNLTFLIFLFLWHHAPAFSAVKSSALIQRSTPSVTKLASTASIEVNNV